MDKTKVMMFQKQKSCAKSIKIKSWRIGDKEIKECVSYKYLGVMIKSNGPFSVHINKVQEKAHKSLFFLYFYKQRMGWFPATSYSLFISPYNCSYSKLCIRNMGF